MYALYFVLLNRHGSWSWLQAASSHYNHIVILTAASHASQTDI
jgi:hypothetical protein